MAMHEEDYQSFGELVDDFQNVPVSVASVGPMMRAQEDPLGGATPGTGAVGPGGGTPAPLPSLTVPQPSHSPPPLASLALGDDGHMSDIAAYLVLAGLLAVVLAWVLWVLYDQKRRLSSKEKGGVSYDSVLEESGTETAAMVQRAKDIHLTIMEGAKAFMRFQVEYVAYLFVALTLGMSLCIASGDHWHTKWRTPPSTDAPLMAYDTAPLLMNAAYFALSTVIGFVTTGVAVHWGISVAANTNVQVALGARQGVKEAYQTMMRGATAVGLAAAGGAVTALFGIMVLFQNRYGDRDNKSLYLAVAGFGLGSAFMALCTRLCGVVYLKSSAVGVRIVQQQMGAGAAPADDPRNPVVIASHVGLLLNAVGASIADLVSSFAVSACAALVLTSMTTMDYQNDFHRTALPLMLTAVGCVAVVGTCAMSMYVFPVDHKNDAERIMLQLIPVASVVATAAAYGATRLMLPTHMRSDLGVEPLELSSNTHVTPFEVWLCVVGGIWLASLLALCQQRFVSPEARTVRQMAESCKTGQAANLIFGVSVGYRSTLAFATALGAVVYLSYEVADYWGVGFAAVGAMTTFGLSVALEMSSAIFDNALAISDMAGLADEPRSAVAALALAGRSVAATSKSLSIGSATLAGVAAWAAFNFTAQVSALVIDKKLVLGLFVGSMLPYWFASIVLMAIGKGASNIANDVFRQYAEVPAILEGTACPDYRACYQIATSASLKTMKWPIVYTCLIPFAVGCLLGVKVLSGCMLGLIVVGLLLSISSQTSGAAWLNTTSFILAGGEGAVPGGKETKAYAHSLMGSILGMPLSEVGPCINMLVKLFAIQSLMLSVFLESHTRKGLIFQIWE